MDGKANRELIRVLSEALGVTSAQVCITRGGTTRRKTVRIDGIGLDMTIQALSGVLVGHAEDPG